MLAVRSDSGAVNDSLIACMQYAASITNLGQRLLARSQEVQALRSQVITLRSMLSDADQQIRRLEKRSKDLEELVYVLQVYEENTRGTQKFSCRCLNSEALNICCNLDYVIFLLCNIESQVPILHNNMKIVSTEFLNHMNF